MTYCECALVVFVALWVLGPKELTTCAFYLGKAWRQVQAVKSLLNAQLIKFETKLTDKTDG